VDPLVPHHVTQSLATFQSQWAVLSYPYKTFGRSHYSTYSFPPPEHANGQPLIGQSYNLENDEALARQAEKEKREEGNIPPRKLTSLQCTQLDTSLTMCSLFVDDE
jgi:hypothetical protein